MLAALRAATEPRRALLAALPVEAGMPVLVGTAPSFLAAVGVLRRVAPTDAAVLLLGPSGSGKELFARALHHLSPRRSGPFVAFNCAAVPETLVESELFGHERGAFTGASARHLGRFEQAHGGTLFLDEVGEVPPATQSKLLRAVEEHSITRLGGESEVVVDVRILAATNRDLEARVEAGGFRRDLFHRLHVFPIRLPALSERREDIPALALHLASRAAERHRAMPPVFGPAAMAALVLAPWPGNVRELGQPRGAGDDHPGWWPGGARGSRAGCNDMPEVPGRSRYRDSGATAGRKPDRRAGGLPRHPSPLTVRPPAVGLGSV